MVSPDILSGRLRKLREYLQVLRNLKKYPLTRFLKDPLIHGSAERYLHLSIECILDIGNHLVSDQRLRAPQDYADVFTILGEAKILPKPFAKKLIPMARFRNLLVHEYAEIDTERVFQILQNHLGDFETFARHIQRKFLP